MHKFAAVVFLLFAGSALGVSNETINEAAKGGVVGVALGLIGAAGVLLWMLVAWLKKKVVPRVKEAAQGTVAVATSLAHEIATRNKSCPHCAETVKREATVCKHCKREI